MEKEIVAECREQFQAHVSSEEYRQVMKDCFSEALLKSTTNQESKIDVKSSPVRDVVLTFLRATASKLSVSISDEEVYEALDDLAKRQPDGADEEEWNRILTSILEKEAIRFCLTHM